MGFRAARAWIVLAALVTVLIASWQASALATVLAGLACIGSCAALVWLDGLRRSGRMGR